MAGRSGEGLRARGGDGSASTRAPGRLRFPLGHCPCPRWACTPSSGRPWAGVSLLFWGRSPTRALPLYSPPLPPHPPSSLCPSRALFLTQLKTLLTPWNVSCRETGRGRTLPGLHPHLEQPRGAGGRWAPGSFLAPPGIRLYDAGRPLASLSLTVSFCSLGCHSPHLMPWLEGDGEKPGADGGVVVARLVTPTVDSDDVDTHIPTRRYLFPSLSSRGCDYMSPIVQMGKLRHEWSGLDRGVQPGSPELGCKLGPA